MLSILTSGGKQLIEGNKDHDTAYRCKNDTKHGFRHKLRQNKITYNGTCWF